MTSPLRNILKFKYIKIVVITTLCAWENRLAVIKGRDGGPDDFRTLRFYNYHVFRFLTRAVLFCQDGARILCLFEWLG